VILPHAGPAVAVVCFAGLSFAIALPISAASRLLFEQRAAAAVRAWLAPARPVPAPGVEIA
jgi:hypothetical protein